MALPGGQLEADPSRGKTQPTFRLLEMQPLPLLPPPLSSVLPTSPPKGPTAGDPLVDKVMLGCARVFLT